MTLAAPTNLIRWYYLWYAGAALALMTAVIASRHLWSLNFVHVFSGLLWTGIDLFMGFLLGPILRAVDIAARKAVLLRLTPRTLFLRLATGTVAVLTPRRARDTRSTHGFASRRGPQIFFTVTIYIS